MPSGRQVPDLGERKHLREHPERPVGLIGRVPHAVVQRRDVLAPDLPDRQTADGGIDEPAHHPAVLRFRARLAIDRHIFLQEPAPERRHGRRLVRLRLARAGIDALLRQGQDFQRPGPRLIDAHRTVRADGEPAQPAADAGLDDVFLPARGADPEPEAGQFAVPIDGVAAVRPDGVDAALGQFRNAAGHSPDISFLTGRHLYFVASNWQTN